MDKDPFQQYIKESEPAKRDKVYAWRTAIGLQAVDGLTTSEYLVKTAVRNIEGEITIEEANELLQSYYADMKVRKPDFEMKKPDIEARKPDIETEKPNIEARKPNIDKIFRSKTANHIRKLQAAFSDQAIFGRSDMMKVTGLKPSRASELIQNLAGHGFIEQVFGYGKGKYRFLRNDGEFNGGKELKIVRKVGGHK